MELFGQTSRDISVYEVGPRDGLQNEKSTVSLHDKLRLIEGLVSSGLRRIEVTSFVSPKWIPQLADADDVATHVKPAPGVVYSALCPNAKGLERAAAAKLPEIAVFMSASETHNKKNINKTIQETIDAFQETIGPAIEKGMRVRGYVSTVWGCPYEGTVDPKASLAIAKRLLAMGCYQISLGDTIGAGTPKQTEQIMKMMLAELPVEALAMHMHDTRGTALANIVVGLELGIRHFDAAVGGMGGCPYAPGAAGNVATEDLIYMLDGMGLTTGVDLSRLLEVGKVAESIVGRQLPSKVLMAGARSLRA